MIHDIIIEAYDERYAPPEHVLRLGVVGDVLAIDIGKYDETNKRTKFTPSETICVPLNDVIRALKVLIPSDAEGHARSIKQRAERGE